MKNERMRTSGIRAILFAAFMFFAQARSNLAAGGEIHDAVKAGDLKSVAAMLAANPGLVSDYDASGQLPLHVAAAHSQTALANLLLTNKADVSARTKRTPTSPTFGMFRPLIDV